jgi:hypothetical protein
MKASVARHFSWASLPSDEPITLHDLLIMEVVGVLDDAFGKLPLRRDEMKCEMYLAREEYSWETIRDTADALRLDGYVVTTELVEANTYRVVVSWCHPSDVH